MKNDIHPKWHDNAEVTCSCGAKFNTGSTLSEIKVDICSKCHPFFTGEMKFVDVQGRVEKFQAKQEKAKAFASTMKVKKVKKVIKSKQAARSLKDVLKEIKTTTTKPAETKSPEKQ